MVLSTIHPSFPHVNHTQYAQLKEHVRQLEEELEGAAGQNEAIKHQLDLRYAKL